MTRRAARVDQNHAEIVHALEQCGWSVISLAALGRGIPDVLCVKAGQLKLCEIKAAKGKLTRMQVTFHQVWPVTLLRSVEDVGHLR